jgi:hypothetical protein
MLVSTPKKKRATEVLQCPVIGSQDSVLLLLKRVRLALRLPVSADSDDETPKKQEKADHPKKRQRCMAKNEESGTTRSKIPNRTHSRKIISWGEGRNLVALGINECSRLLGSCSYNFKNVVPANIIVLALLQKNLHACWFQCRHQNPRQTHRRSHPQTQQLHRSEFHRHKSCCFAGACVPFIWLITSSSLQNEKTVRVW